MKRMRALLRPVVAVDAGPVWAQRLDTLARALSAPPPERPGDMGDLVRASQRIVDLTDRSHVWLALATLSGVLPEDRTVVRTVRECELVGADALWQEVTQATTPSSLRPTVRIVQGGTLVDVNHTVATDLATGIQRVARQTVRRWSATRELLPTAWTDGFLALRDLTAQERERLLPDHKTSSVASGIVVPWQSTVLVPELAAEHSRSDRLLALAAHSGNRTGVIGFDCVPLTSAETTADGFAAVFFGNLAAVRHFDRIAAISGAAAVEYEGWRRMLQAVGSEGPRIRAIALPAEAPEPTAADLARARSRFIVGELPLVLAVGSHEPRKNHLAVLHAAELRWRAGDRFSLTFVGGNSWQSEEFMTRLAELQRRGRPVDSASRVSDDMLWAAYRLAHVTVFPSLNEGFGLPVAESLASGTPVITSRYGSMREIAQHGGALLVDPRDDRSIADALSKVLSDEDLRGRLTAEARAASGRRTWQDYADELWDFLQG